MPLFIDSTGNTLTRQIIGAAMTVHNSLGPGLKEEVYEKALFLELKKCEMAVQRQAPVPVYYDDQEVKLFFLDLLVEDQVIVELKAFAHQLTGDEMAQVINYLNAAKKPVGLLFNFGRRRLEFHRIFPPRNPNTPVQRTGRDNVYKPR